VSAAKYLNLWGSQQKMHIITAVPLNSLAEIEAIYDASKAIIETEFRF
jgi:hypothetical protein